MGDLMVRPQGGEILQQGFDSQEIRPYSETAAAAVAAREQAAIQARYIMAMRSPRNIEQYRQKLLKECQRVSFAEVARYSKPVGGSNIEGPSIRFVETALRCYRNVFPEVTTVFDSDQLRICRIVVTDLESNISYATEIQVEKTVERRSAKGREAISSRSNSNGDKVYLVVATDDEVTTKQNALISKAIRTQGLRLLPGDITAEAEDVIIKTLEGGIAADPVAALRMLLDSLAKDFNIQADDIVAWAGKPIDRLTPKEIGQLRKLGAAMRDGETTWDQIMAAKDPAGSTEAAAGVAKRKLDLMKQQAPPPQQPAEQPKPAADPKAAINEKQQADIGKAAATATLSGEELAEIIKPYPTIAAIPAGEYQRIVEAILAAGQAKNPDPPKQEEKQGRRGGLRL